MWPWIKRWRDWAMNDLWPLYRINPQPQALHYSYEKAGLTLHDQPIPWNAEAVVVDIDPLPAVIGFDGLKSGAPAIWDDCPDNVAFCWTGGDAEATAARGSAHRYRLRAWRSLQSGA